MIDQSMVNRLPGCEVIDRGGEKIGSVSQVWVDSRNGSPAWASVQSGLFGLKETFVPLQRAELHDGHMMVPVSKDQVKGAPRIDAATGQISEDEQVALCRHYGLPGPKDSPSDRDARARRHSGPTAGRGEAMTRSEERLKVDAERAEIGRVRLVKHVVTENQRVAVPVSHEEVRLEREPITDADRDASMASPELTEAKHEVRLHAEKPVVSKEKVPVERVRLTKDTVRENKTMSGKVRKEQVEVEDAAGQLSRRPDPRPRPPRNPR